MSSTQAPRISRGRFVTPVIALSILVALPPLVAGAPSSVPATQPSSRTAAGLEPAATAQVPSPITRIQLRLQTGNLADAGTDGDVFLGVAGREFFVDSSSNDFERASNRTYVFGDGANVVRPTQNDPRTPWQLTFDDLSLAPRYLRFEPGSDWNIGRVDLTVSYAGGSLSVSSLAGNANLWLGEKRGKYLFLR